MGLKKKGNEDSKMKLLGVFAHLKSYRDAGTVFEVTVEEKGAIRVDLSKLSVEGIFFCYIFFLSWKDEFSN